MTHIMINLNNKYLYITEDNSLFNINSCDYVFSSYYSRKTREEFINYCKENANNFRHSDLSNYKKLDNKDRETLAKRWEDAVHLKPGNYDYYFNLQSKQDIFKQAVADVAKELNIDQYNLIMS